MGKKFNSLFPNWKFLNIKISNGHRKGLRFVFCIWIRLYYVKPYMYMNFKLSKLTVDVIAKSLEQ